MKRLIILTFFAAGVLLAGEGPFQSRQDLNGKRTLLVYPHPEEKNRFYVGLGGGAEPQEEFPGFDGESRQRVVMAEGVVGYEWRHSNDYRSYLQLGVSEPVSGRRGRSPGVAISYGLSF